jgi:hypothetical protein
MKRKFYVKYDGIVGWLVLSIKKYFAENNDCFATSTIMYNILEKYTDLNIHLKIDCGIICSILLLQ